jgi:hypothetical protein
LQARSDRCPHAVDPLIRGRFGARVMQTLRRLTKHAHGLTSSAALHPGVLIVVQRFRNDLGLFVHVHALATDGCFDASDEQELRFLPIVGQLTDEHLLHTPQRMHPDFAALEGDHDDDVDHEVDAAMAACIQLALPLRPATPSCPEPAPASPLLVTAFGMQLDAAVTVGMNVGPVTPTVELVAPGLHARPPVRDGRGLADQSPSDGAAFCSDHAPLAACGIPTLYPQPGYSTVTDPALLSFARSERGAITPRTTSSTLRGVSKVRSLSRVRRRTRGGGCLGEGRLAIGE